MNMNILLISVIACQKIIENKEPLKKVMASIYAQYNFSNTQKSRINKLLKGVLRKYVTLKYEVNSAFENPKPREKKLYLFICALFSLRYQSGEVELETVKNEFSSVVDEFKMNVEIQETFDVLVDLSKKRFIVPEEEKNNPIRYNSLMFSTPEWVIRMWLKQFGQETTLKLLISNQKPVNFYVKRNELKVSAKSFEKNGDFLPVEGFENAYNYIGKSGFFKTNEARVGNCFKEDLSYQEILNQLEIVGGCNALLINGDRSGLAIDLAVRLREVNGDLTMNIEDDITYRKAEYRFEKLGIKNKQTYLADIDLLRTYIGYESYDLVLVLPKSSRLGLVKKNAEILASISKQDYKKLKYYQLACLEEASRYINSEGTFVYLVETINKREGEDIVELFMEKHEGFELVKSRQIMPFEKNNNGVYYAVLRRNYERKD